MRVCASVTRPRVCTVKGRLRKQKKNAKRWNVGREEGEEKEVFIYRKYFCIVATDDWVEDYTRVDVAVQTS